MEGNEAIVPAEASVQIRGGSETVVVIEPNWKAVRSLLGKVTEQATHLITFDKAGKPQINRGAIVGVITSSLADDLLSATTGKDAAWIDALPIKDAVNLLVAAVDVTFHADMIETVKNALGKLRVITTQTGDSGTLA